MTEPISHPKTADAIRGPWSAVATDSNGYVVKPAEEEHWVDLCAFVVVVRGSAEPIGNRRMPEEADADDVLYERDLVGDPPERVETCWEQAQAVAAALNDRAQVGAR